MRIFARLLCGCRAGLGGSTVPLCRRRLPVLLCALTSAWLLLGGGPARASGSASDFTKLTAGQSLAEARAGAVAATLPNGQVLIAGGSGSFGELSSAELFVPAARAQIAGGTFGEQTIGEHSAAAEGQASATLTLGDNESEPVAMNLGGTGVAPVHGPQGEKGATGAQGEKGATGTTGAPGTTGAAGAQGEKGAAGATGAAGTTGATGAQAAKGEKEATGPTGAQGEKGVTRATGATGATGAPGATGPREVRALLVLRGDGAPPVPRVPRATWSS